MQNILIIDDDSAFRDTASMVFEDEGHTVRHASCAEEAYAMLIGGERFDTIFCDLHMPLTNGSRQEDYRYTVDVGYRTAKELASILKGSTVIVLSAVSPSDIMRLIPHLHPVQAYSKPTAARDLLNLLDNRVMPQ